MDAALRQLIRVSRAVGKDTSLVQGGGGNTSVKTRDGRRMYIKASGTALKDMAEGRGWRRLGVKSVLAILDEESLRGLDEGPRESRVMDRLLTSCDDGLADDARPSVESHLHAFLGRCVVHLHPVAVGSYVCAKNGRAALARLFGGRERPPLWVPYADPGYRLAVRIRRLIREYAERHGTGPSVLFLEKHGVIVSADTPERALAEVRRTVAICEGKSRPVRPARALSARREEVAGLKLGIRRAYFEATGKRVAVKHFAGEMVARFLGRRNARRLVSPAALTPDEFAYAGGPPLWVERGAADSILAGLRRRMKRDGRPAMSFLVPRVGLFVAGSENSIELVKEVVTASLAVRVGASAHGGVMALNRRQRDFIANWEMEGFRKQVAGLGGDGELMGQIAVVTGAGSGLGRSIAAGLARAGATLALADIDVSSAEQTAAAIGKETPAACAAAVACDVTSEEQVERAVQGVVDRWGGVDILVNAAGIAPPYSLVDLPVGQWQRALDINLTGYFLMARSAARVMIEQGMGGSKSGLEASRENTAYNATKAGEIHMARGWALELGEHGIRTNSVAPGNVFEGSQVWNPDYMKACARKYGIKPEEVIPHYVNMTALKRRITGRDVADAVVFLCSERARTITGQTLVPDSGQVMVR